MDSEFLEGASAGVIIGAAALLVITLISIRSLGTRLLVVLLLAAVAGGGFWYRDHLDECEKTCDCSLLGEDVPVEGCNFAAREAEAP